MPSRNNRRHRSPTLSTEVTPTKLSEVLHSNTSTISAREPSLKELMVLVPCYTSPAYIFASKIRLLWPTSHQAPTFLSHVIRLRLPSTLYELTSDTDFASHIALLEKVCALESPSRMAATQTLLESKQQLRLDQSPREFLGEMKRLARLVFPSYTTSEIALLAWNKLLVGLPAPLQQTLSLLPHSDSSEESLEALDRAWKLQATATSLVATAQPAAEEKPVAELLREISDRLTRLESSTSLQPHLSSAVMHRRFIEQPPLFRNQPASSSSLCWYHARFGDAAQRCQSPCSFKSKGSGNGARAPSH
jgi:hypothetical protein